MSAIGSIAGFIVTIFCIFVVLTLVLDRDSRPQDKPAPGPYASALIAYKQAQANFDAAEPRYIDVAISDLGVSENRVDAEIRRAKRQQGLPSWQQETVWVKRDGNGVIVGVEEKLPWQEKQPSCQTAAQ